jgi:mannose PTS system EIIA component
MIGIVLVTHGRLAEEFIAATEHVVGEQQAIEAICIAPDEDMDQRRQDIIKAVARANQGRGVVILTDMFGGTPSNLAISLLGQEDIEVIAGINLPMLIKLVSVRKDASLKDAVLAAQEAGRKYINVATNLLAGDKKASA